MTRAKKYSPEVRERAVRMVFEHESEYSSQWAAIQSIAEKIGCSGETLRNWVRRAERDAGKRPGLTTTERERIKELERENRELRRANEILRKAADFSPRRSSTANRGDGGLHRRVPAAVWSRADLQRAADRSIHRLRAQSTAA